MKPAALWINPLMTHQSSFSPVCRVVDSAIIYEEASSLFIQRLCIYKQFVCFDIKMCCFELDNIELKSVIKAIVD